MYHKKIKHLNVRIKCVLFIICGLLVSNSHNVYATDDLIFIEGEQNIQKRDLEDPLCGRIIKPDEVLGKVYKIYWPLDRNRAIK